LILSLEENHSELQKEIISLETNIKAQLKAIHDASSRRISKEGLATIRKTRYVFTKMFIF
jgi:hypothetical protein